MADAPTIPAKTPVPSVWADRCLLILIAVLVAMLGWRWVRDHFSARPTEITSPRSLLDLNRATSTELEQLPGFGPQLATRVVQYRDANGPFQRLEDLRLVGGVGDQTLAKIRPWVTGLSPPPESTLVPEPDRLVRQSPQVVAAPAKPVTTPSRTNAGAVGKRTTGEGKLNINTADADELARLPGIGPVLARRIIDARSQKPFTGLEDLRRVGGIGPKRLDTLRELITFED